MRPLPSPDPRVCTSAQIVASHRLATFADEYGIERYRFGVPLHRRPIEERLHDPDVARYHVERRAYRERHPGDS